MLRYQDILFQQERYKDLRRQAEKERLLRQVLTRSKHHSRLHHRLLIWLASRLIAWGQGLEERYRTVATAS